MGVETVDRNNRKIEYFGVSEKGHIPIRPNKPNQD